MSVSLNQYLLHIVKGNTMCCYSTWHAFSPSLKIHSEPIFLAKGFFLSIKARVFIYSSVLPIPVMKFGIKRI